MGFLNEKDRKDLSPFEKGIAALRALGIGVLLGVGLLALVYFIGGAL